MKKLLTVHADTGIATVGKRSFEKHLPEGMTVAQVDQAVNAVQQFSAKVFDEAVSYAAEHSKAVTVAPYNMGKHVTGNVTIGDDFQAVATLSFVECDEMTAVVKRANDLFINSVKPDADTDDDDDETVSVTVPF